MKILKLNFTTFIIAALGLLCFSCSNEDDPKPDPNPLDTSHFDIWVTVGEGTSGMGADPGAQLVMPTKSLEEQGTIDFAGKGANVSAKLNQESIIKGQYYYQVPRSDDRFGKYKIGTNGIETVKEIVWGTNTYSARKYTNAWIDDNTLVLLAANGAKDKVLWTKIDVANMKILSEGVLNLPALPTGGTFSTSGIASYRSADNKILYSYCNNKDKVRFYMAFVNASDMSVEATVSEDRAEFMAGTAYGELLQSKSFFDNNGDYYLACNTVIPGAPSTTQQFGSLLRIKKGALAFDKTYVGYKTPSGGKGKIITVEHLTSGKALLYIMDPAYTGASGWGADYNCYYSILDLTSDKLTVLTEVPFSQGNFSQRSAVLGSKAYIGANPKTSNPCIYIYDIPTGKITKGLTITEGYSFDRIVALLD